MPHREHSTGDGCQRILCKVGSGQRSGQTGVLHTDLDGNCTALGRIQLQQLAHAKAGEVAQQVVQDDHGQDQQAAGQILAEFADTTAQMMSTMAVVEISGSTRTAFWVKAWKK